MDCGEPLQKGSSICIYTYINKIFIVLPKKGFSTETGGSQGRKFVKQILRSPV